jgi:hypothetical protein
VCETLRAVWYWIDARRLAGDQACKQPPARRPAAHAEMAVAECEIETWAARYRPRIGRLSGVEGRTPVQ